MIRKETSDSRMFFTRYCGP